MQVVALVEDLTFHVGVHLTEPPDLAILLGDQALVHRRDLDVDTLFWQVEVGGEVLHGLPGVVKLNRECGRLVFPADSVEIQQARELTFTVVGKFLGLGGRDGFRVSFGGQVASAVLAGSVPASASSSLRGLANSGKSS